MKTLDTQIFKTSEELADYLCWKAVSQLISSISTNPDFFDKYELLIDNAVNLFSINEPNSDELRQEASLSLDNLARYLQKRADQLARNLEEKDRFGG